jgi:predicted NUDIX family phosphoesterase
MTMNTPQRIQVVPARIVDAILPLLGPGPFIHLPPAHAFAPLRDLAGTSHYMDRAAVEDDLAFRQLIPYAVLTSRDLGILAYRRSKLGGEGRLHGRWSIGWGGHVDCGTDSPHDPSTPYAIGQMVAWWACLRRELREELGGDVPAPISLRGLIDDRSDAVGAVHLGLACEVDVTGVEMPDAGLRSDEIGEMRWIGLGDDGAWAAVEGEMEKWSRVVMGAMTAGNW